MTPARSDAFAGYFYVIAAAAQWACWPFLLRYAASFGPLPSNLQAVLVMAMVGLCAIPGAIVAGRRRTTKATPLQWLSIGLLGLCGGGNLLLLFAAYKATSVAIAVLTHYLTPLLVALAAPLIGERMTARKFFAVTVAFAGLGLLLEPWNTVGRGKDLLGATCGAGSAVFYALMVLLQKRLSRVFEANEILAVHAAVATPFLALFVPTAAWTASSWQSIAVIVVGGVGPGWLAGAFFLRGLARVPAYHAATLTLLEPTLAVVAASIVYKEPLGLLSVVGAAAILGGAALVMVEPKPTS